MYTWLCWCEHASVYAWDGTIVCVSVRVEACVDVYVCVCVKFTSGYVTLLSKYIATPFSSPVSSYLTRYFCLRV